MFHSFEYFGVYCRAKSADISIFNGVAYFVIKDEDVLDETIETEPLDGQSSESDSDESSQDGQPDREPVSEDSEREAVQEEDCEREPVQEEEDYGREPVQEEDCVDEEEVTEDTSLVQDLKETLEKSETELPLSAPSRGSDGKNLFGHGSSHKEAVPSQKSPHSPEVSLSNVM